MSAPSKNAAPSKTGRREMVKVTPLTTVALNRKITPATLLQWLAGFGLTGAVGYDTNADLILQAIPRGHAGGAEWRLVDALADTLRWLAVSPQDAHPPRGYTDDVLWEACLLARKLPASERLVDALIEFYRVATRREPPLPKEVWRELTEALRAQQPGDLHRRERAKAQDFWQGLWLDVLTGRSRFLACFRDDAILSLLEATFGREKSEPLKPKVSNIREAADDAYDESRQKSNDRYLNAVRTEGKLTLSQIDGKPQKDVLDLFQESGQSLECVAA